jgi:hypothetical protein
MDQNEIEAIRALLSSKPRPVGWAERRQRLDEVGSVWPVADDITLEPVDVALLHGLDHARIEYARSPTSSDADGLRASELEHAVQGTDSDRSLSRTTPVGPRTQRVTDHSFEATDS